MNCLSPDWVSACLPALRASGLPYGAYPNLLGAPAPDWADRHPVPAMSMPEFLDVATSWLRDGIDAIGGCCGTTPEHIRELGRVRGIAESKGA